MFESWVGSARYKKVEHLILEERRKLLEGEFDNLLSLARKREALVNSLIESRALTVGQVQKLKMMAERNQRCLASALEGIRKARQQVGQKNSLISNTYDKNGVMVKSGTSVPERNVKA